jgi:hypothetical protein
MKGLVVLILSLSLWRRACAQGRFAVHTASYRSGKVNRDSLSDWAVR